MRLKAENKKALEMTLSTVITAILLITLLVVVAIIASKGFATTSQVKDCEGKGGECITGKVCTDNYPIFGKCSEGKVCCKKNDNTK